MLDFKNLKQFKCMTAPRDEGFFLCRANGMISCLIIAVVKNQLLVNALAINVAIPEDLQWTDVREGKRYTLNTLNIRILPSGHLAARAYGRPEDGGHGTYVAFPVRESEKIQALIDDATVQASERWLNHKGFQRS
jgi:hypothetical protein